MSVREIERSLEQREMREMNDKDVHRRMILAPTPRERWYAMLPLSQDWMAVATANWKQ
jgi:hypothetical protein